MIEHATAEARSAAAALARAPAHILAAANRSRVRQGLTPIAYRRQEQPRTYVLWDAASPHNPARKSSREEAAARCKAIRQRAAVAIAKLKACQ